MFNTNSGYSLADIAAATGNGRSCGNDMFGDNGAWWIIILFLFCFAGWGGNAWGNGGSYGANGATTRESISYGFDMSGLRSNVTDLAGNMAEGFYSINNGMLTGFANTAAAVNSGVQAVQSDICAMSMANLQNTNTLQAAINADTIANMQNTYGLTTQLNNMSAAQAACCCETEQLIQSKFADLNYNLASTACQNRQAVVDGVRDIIDNNNSNTRAILDFLVQDKIDSLNAENANLRGQISQSEQNAYLLEQLRPTAQPSYIVANPYTGSSYTSYGCGYGAGCGCSLA